MDNKFTAIKNPLSVIAIFAGIAEISGTAVLPLMAPENQALYIWFLMLFPFGLIGCFFLTLNFNHRVLYAPSDFRDEDNFVNILKKSTFSEILEYKSGEIKAAMLDDAVESATEEIEGESESRITKQATSEPESFEQQLNDSWLTHVETCLVKSKVASTRSERDQIDLISRQISEQRMRDSRLAEKLALEALEKELGVSIDREMKIESGPSRIHFDGIARRGNALTAIEVKYCRYRRSLPMSVAMWHDLRHGLEKLYQSLTEEQRRSFSFVLVIVGDGNLNEIASIAERRLEDLPFPTAIKLYEFDELLVRAG